MVKQITVLVVDEFPIVRWALRSFLSRQPNISVVGEAPSVEDAISIARLSKPDIMTAEILHSRGKLLPPSLVTSVWPVKVVAYSEHSAWSYIEAFLKAGGHGFVSKRSPLDELVLAIEAAMEDRQWVSPELRSAAPIKVTPDCGIEVLSSREQEIVSLVATGLTSKQIADQLCVSKRTVENHRHRIFQKLDISRSAELVSYAIERGLVGVQHGNAVR